MPMRPISRVRKLGAEPQMAVMALQKAMLAATRLRRFVRSASRPKGRVARPKVTEKARPEARPNWPSLRWNSRRMASTQMVMMARSITAQVVIRVSRKRIR